MRIFRCLIVAMGVCFLGGVVLAGEGDKPGPKPKSEAGPEAEPEKPKKKKKAPTVKTASETYGFRGKEVLPLGGEEDEEDDDEEKDEDAIEEEDLTGEIGSDELDDLSPMQLIDADGDGRTDLFFMSQEAGKFYIFFRNEKRDGFTRESYDLDDEFRDYELADLNEDGLADLLILVVNDKKDKKKVGDKPALKVRFGKPERKFGKAEKTELEGLLLYVLDLAKDDRGVVFLLDKTDIRMVRCGKDGTFGKPTVYQNPHRRHGLVARDLTGDGRSDLVLLGGRLSHEIALRPQLPDGTFGPEVRAETDGMLFALEDMDGDGRADLFSLHPKTRALTVQTFLTAKEVRAQRKGKAPRFHFGQMEPILFDDAAKGEEKGIAVGDLNGDGRTDIAVSDGANARMLVYLQDAHGGLGRATTFSTFAGAIDPVVANLVGDGANELVVYSSKEKVIGLSRTGGAKKLVSFPKAIPVTFEPTAFACGDFSKNGRTELIYASLETLESGDQVGYVTIMAAGPKDEALKPRLHWKLDKKDGTEINRFRLGDLNGDGRLDFVAFYEISRYPGLFIQKADGTFENIALRPGFQKGFIKGLRSDRVTLADLEGDGAQELLVSEKGYVKVLGIDKNGQLTRPDQYSGKKPNSRLFRSLVGDLDGDGVNELILEDSAAEGLSILVQTEGEGMKIDKTIRLDRIGPDQILLVDLNQDKKKDILIFADTKLGIFYADRLDPKLEPTYSFRTKIKGAAYSSMAIGDINGDGTLDLVMADGKKHYIEILSVDKKKKKLVHELAFLTFKEPKLAMQERGEDWRHRGYFEDRPREVKKEPRRLRLADMDGDGKLDIVTRLHNNVIIYFQE